MKSHERKARKFEVGETLRMPAYKTSGGFRVWNVAGVNLGSTYQEGTYHLVAVDLHPNEEIHVPCIILETHHLIQRV